MSDRILIIKAKGGLGNRMLSAVSGLIFADLTGRKPVIDWRDGSYGPLDTNAYPLLFDTPITLRAEDFDTATVPVTPAIWNGHLGLTPERMVGLFDPDRHASATVYRRFCADLSRLDAPEEIAVFWCYLPKFGRLARHMRASDLFRGQALDAVIEGYLKRYFTPNARIRAGVDAVMAQLAAPVIGVHIRYTDRKIPLHRVKAALRRRMAGQPGAHVFLATDNAAVQAEMAAEFPGIRHIDKHLNADGTRLHWPAATFEKTREAENALIDMGALARCDHLIYSKHSTFSVTAACIGRLPATRQDDVDRFNLPVVAKRIVQNYI